MLETLEIIGFSICLLMAIFCGLVLISYWAWKVEERRVEKGMRKKSVGDSGNGRVSDSGNYYCSDVTPMYEWSPKRSVKSVVIDSFNRFLE